MTDEEWEYIKPYFAKMMSAKQAMDKLVAATSNGRMAVDADLAVDDTIYHDYEHAMFEYLGAKGRILSKRERESD